jgi:ABC-type amino acid transport substrate-binding protein
MRKQAGWLTALIALTLIAAACGKKSESAPPASAAARTASAAASDSPSPGAPAEIRKIVVGTGTTFPLVCFIDENGKLTGFDVELVREIDKRLPQYEFEFQTLDFSNILLSLETKKIGVFFFLGVAGPHEWHHPAFDVDERALPIAAKLLAGVAVDAIASLLPGAGGRG